jgi:hypothetical protein
MHEHVNDLPLRRGTPLLRRKRPEPAMADNTEEALDERLERIQRRAENFRELLRDGDEVTIAFQDGEVHVEESYRSKFERKHAKLFGRMLAIEAQMDAGLFPYFAALVLTGAVIFGLAMGWWDAVLGESAAAQLNSWWFYIVLPFVMLYLARLGCGQWERLVYRRNRGALMELIAAANLDRDVLLVMLRDEDDLTGIVHKLKLDAGPLPQPPLAA